MIRATRTQAAESNDGASLEFIVRVPAARAGHLLDAWPVGTEVTLSVLIGSEAAGDKRATEGESPRPAPATQRIDGAGGLDISGFGAFTGGTPDARAIFREKHLALISSPAFQEFAAANSAEPIDPFHSPAQIAQAWLTAEIRRTDPAKQMEKFDQYCNTYVGTVTLDIEG